MKKYYFPVLASLVVSFAFAAIYAYGATTISTNINTGGTLTVSGATTLSGAATLSGDSTFGDASTDVNLFTGTLQATTTALFTAGATVYDNLVFATTSDNDFSTRTPVTGGLYYDGVNRTLRLSDGIEWFTVGTTSNGFTLSGTRLQAADLGYHYTFGTTSPSNIAYGLNVITLAPTTTNSVPLAIYRDVPLLTADLMKVVDESEDEEINFFKIDSRGTLLVATGTPVANSTLTLTGSTTDTVPLSIKGKTGQAGNLFQVQSSDGVALFTLDSSGEISTAFSASSTAAISGTLSLTGILAGSSDIGAATATPFATLSVDQEKDQYPFWVGDAGTSTPSLAVDMNGQLMIATTTLTSTAVDVGIGTGSATTTIEIPRACFVSSDQAGNTIYYYPCVGDDCLHVDNTGLAISTGWATSTDSCAD